MLPGRALFWTVRSPIPQAAPCQKKKSYTMRRCAGSTSKPAEAHLAACAARACSMLDRQKSTTSGRRVLMLLCAMLSQRPGLLTSFTACQHTAQHSGNFQGHHASLAACASGAQEPILCPCPYELKHSQSHIETTGLGSEPSRARACGQDCRETQTASACGCCWAEMQTACAEAHCHQSRSAAQQRTL